MNEKVKDAIERLKAFEPKEGYYLAFSGGKDSVVCKALCDMAGVKYDAVYRVTSVDPPELVRFIKEKHPDVKLEVPHDKNGKPITMWNLIPQKMMPPTRIARYCCAELKEPGGDGRITITGVRWAESVRRKNNQGLVTITSKAAGRELHDNPHFRVNKQGGIILVNDNEDSRRMIESCYRRHKTMVNPIIDWTDADVWNFIRGHNIPYCVLYDEGWLRIGCIGCPMSGRVVRERDFIRYPKYKAAYFRAFDKMIKRRMQRHEKDPSRPVWRSSGADVDHATAQDVFNWWMEYDVLPGQITFDELLEEGEDE